jgi:hypothetical protein
MLVYRFYRKSLRKRRGVSQLEWSFSNFNDSAGPAPGAFELSGAILSENRYPQPAFSLDRALAAIHLTGRVRPAHHASCRITPPAMAKEATAVF